MTSNISTSGRSPNAVRALEAARERGAVPIAFTGSRGGPIADVVELHILAWHAICDVTEAALVG